jgi:threonine/homoserine/homoserine lactone efflux protein
MSIDIILTFTLISILLVVSPGPNGILILKNMPLYGKQSAMNNVFGIFLATYLHGALSFFGLSAIILSSAELFMIIKIIGALYLLFIGTKALYSVFKNNKDIRKKIHSNIKKDKNKSNKIFFIEGFLTQVLNPKVSMFYLAAFPQLIDFKNAVITDIFILTSIHAFSMLIWFAMFIFLLGKSKKAFSSSKIKDIINTVTGVVFIYFAYKILTIEEK